MTASNPICYTHTSDSRELLETHEPCSAHLFLADPPYASCKDSRLAFGKRKKSISRKADANLEAVLASAVPRPTIHGGRP